MKIKIKTEVDVVGVGTQITTVELDSRYLTQSAVTNNIDTESFIATLDKFCYQSTSPRQRVQEWRDDAGAEYMRLKKANTGTTTS